MRTSNRKHKLGTAGFTLVELMIVISILLVLMSIAIPVYEQTIIHAKETVLRQDLFTMRRAIDQYTGDKQKAPQTLQELVSAGYLTRHLPQDPFTHATDTWQAEQSSVEMSSIEQEPGIVDVHSGSSLTASDGSAYNSW